MPEIFINGQYDLDLRVGHDCRETIGNDRHRFRLLIDRLLTACWIHDRQSAMAENAIPGWPGSDYGGVPGVVTGGLKMMWDEGPGGGHYESMASRQYTKIGCGITVTSRGDVWVVQNFK